MQRWAGLALLWSTVAAAEPTTTTVEAARRELALDDVRVRGFNAQAFAQVSGGATDAAEGDLAIGGELSVVGPRCDYLRLGGQTRLGWRGGAQASAEQWAGFCIPVVVWEFGHHLEWDVRPSLLAPLQLRAGTNRRETASFHWQPLRMNAHLLLASLQDPSDPTPRPPLSPQTKLPVGDLAVFEVWTDVSFLWSATTPLAMETTADVATFRYIREHAAAWADHRDFTVDVFEAGVTSSEVINGTQQAFGIHLWGLKIENLELGPMYASGGIGLDSASAGPLVNAADYTHEVDVTRARALLALETGNRDLRGHVRATMDTTVIADGYLTADSRIGAGVAFDAHGTKVSIDGAIARTKLLVPKVMPITAATGGASLSAVRHLNKHLQATLMVDVARSFYAPEVTTLDFTPRWGAQVFGALQATAQR